MTKPKNGSESTAAAPPELKVGNDVVVTKEEFSVTVMDADGSNPRRLTVPNDVVLSWAASIFSGNRRKPVSGPTT